MKIDAEKLLLDNNIIDVIGRRLALTKRGSEHYGVCPFHSDEKASLQVNEKKQIYKCYPCGAGGDAIDFLMRLGSSFTEACAEVNGGEIPEGSTPEQRQATLAKKPKVISWKHIHPAPAVQHAIQHYKFGLPTRTDLYHSPDGGVYGYSCRFDFPDGKKMVLPYIYATDGNRYEWRWQGFEQPRYPYNVHLLLANPKASVLIVEGEKTAEAAQKHLDVAKTVVLTWLGGADGINATKWSLLKDRNVIYWRDNDFGFKYGDKHPKAGQEMPWYEQPGTKAMLRIHDKIKDIAKLTKWVNIPSGLPNKWDAADKEWQPGELRQFVKDNLIDVPTFVATINEVEGVPTDGMFEASEKPKKTKLEGPKNPPLPPVVNKPSNPERDGSAFDNPDFRILGYDKDENSRLVYFFFSYDAKTVIKLSPSSMTKSNLMMLAPINWWEGMFPGKNGVSIDSAQQYLISISHKRGIFKETYIRGRGAWMDEKSIVIHTGDMLLSEGQLVPLENFKSRYMYEIGERLGFGTCTPLKNAESSEFINRMKWLTWEREINAYLLAGWCVIAPFCGVLPWRPHIWVTGSAGSGKSWIVENVLKRMLGDSAVVFQGKTTEPGIRGALQNDARPVVFDESDVDNSNDVSRIQAIISLARASSSKDGGDVAKGTQTGGSRSYKTRTCMAFSSIGIQLDNQADYTRFTPLGLRSHESIRTKSEFLKYEEEWNKLATDDYVKALQSRTIGLLPVILKNAKTFASAATHVLGNTRTGDQLGSMLAGAYSLSSTKEISLEDALAWVESKDWNEERGLELTKDEYQLFARIMGHVTKVEGQYGAVERSVGELILTASYKMDMLYVSADTAKDKLRRLGVLVVNDEIYISNTAEGIKNIVRGTSWEKNHHTVLARLKDAKKIAQRSYGPGGQSRGISLPLSMLLDGFTPDQTVFSINNTQNDDDMPF